MRPDNPYSDFYGTLRLYDGRGFSAQNAIELFGFIGLQGGTLSAPSIDGNEVFFGSGFGTVLSSFIQGFGTVDATLTGNLAIEATDYGTLKIDGDVSNLYASYTVDPNATLEVTHDLVNYATFFLKGGATAVLDGRLIDSASHLARLERSARALDIELPLTIAEIETVERALIARNRLDRGTVYLQLTRGAGERDFLGEPERPTLLLFTQAG